MEQSSAEEKPLSELRQIGQVVTDMERTVDYYSSLGLGPFRMLDKVDFINTTLRGSPNQFKARIAVAQLGQVQLEVIQITEGESSHREFLQEKGEGLHHLGFLVRDRQSAAAGFAAKGVVALQSGEMTRGGGFTYMDTAGIGGVVFELAEPPPRPQSQRPAERPAGQSAVQSSLFAEPKHVGMLVTDLDRTVAYYSSLGMGRFRAFEMEFADATPQSRFSSTFKVKVAFVRLGRVQLELIQLLEGYSFHRDVLQRRGEGLHHLAFEVADVDQEVANFTEKGGSLLQSGKFPGGGWAFLDMESIGGMAIELMQLPAQPSR